MRFSLDAIQASPRHPAAFPDYMALTLRHWVPKGDVLDPFGGVGRLAQLLPAPDWRVTSLEIEHEWAVQGEDNGCVLCIHGDATRMPFPDAVWPAVCFSPAYGNRYSDAYIPPGNRPSDKTRRSYRIFLGRDLHARSGARPHFGKGYEPLHVVAAQEIARVVRPGGTVVCNVKDFIRTKRESGGATTATVVGVVAFWDRALEDAGLERIGDDVVFTPGDQNTNRHRQQGRPTVDHETILVFRKPVRIEAADSLDTGGSTTTATKPRFRLP